MKTRVTITLDPEVHARARPIARARRTTVSGLIEALLRSPEAAGTGRSSPVDEMLGSAELRTVERGRGGLALVDQLRLSAQRGGRFFLERLLRLVEVAPVATAYARRALGLPMSDIGDAFPAAAARAWKADVIVTRNVSDYRHSPVRAIAPAAFLKQAGARVERAWSCARVLRDAGHSRFESGEPSTLLRSSRWPSLPHPHSRRRARPAERQGPGSP